MKVETGGARLISDIKCGKIRKQCLPNPNVTTYSEEEILERYNKYLYTLQYSLLENLCKNTRNLV
jgi:hypothetical protein